MSLSLVSALFLFSFVSVSLGAGCDSDSPDYGNPNTFPVLDGNAAMKLVKTVDNGKLYQVTVPNSGGNTSSPFYVVHVFGTPYQMGQAQGQLLPTEVSTFIDQVWSYFEEQIDEVINFVPSWLANLIADVGLDLALDLTYAATRSYTGTHIYDEMRGLADASGTDYNRLVRVHMIAGLTQGKCSMFGAWGKALDPTSSTKLLQLRALDWDMDGPFRNYPAIIVYHPVGGYGHAFANIGMVGFLGGLTGISSSQLGISEIGVAFPDETFGAESRIGVPFIFLLRDILQYDLTVDDAVNRMTNTRRTCDLILGVGDGKLGEFRGFEYSYAHLYVFDDDNLRPNNDTWHPRIDDIVYWGMDWICPSYNLVLSSLLKKFYGKITPELALREISAVEMSGDNHLAFYDLTNSKFWVSFAAGKAYGGPVEAYNRQFTKFDALALFQEPHP